MRQLKIEEKYTQRNDLVMKYFTDVEKEKMLNPEEEFEVAKRAASGDKEAIEKLIKANLRFVISVAKQYSVNPEMLNDLIAQGNIGLIDAAKTFDPSRGFKFISYAVWHVRKEIMLYLNNLERTVRVPTNVTQDLSRIRKASERLEADLGRTPTSSEISEKIDKMGLKPIPADKIESVMRHGYQIAPLESSSHEDGLSPIDVIESGSDEFDSVDMIGIEVLYSFLSRHLTAIEQEILTRRHGIGNAGEESFGTIALRYGKSAEWARQVYTKALRRLRGKIQRDRKSYGSLLEHLS